MRVWMKRALLVALVALAGLVGFFITPGLIVAPLTSLGFLAVPECQDSFRRAASFSSCRAETYVGFRLAGAVVLMLTVLLLTRARGPKDQRADRS